jgi:hypothetical protein
MPVARYFLIVGGLLLGLLFIADACMSTLPLAERADSNRAVIRIHSEMKLPERVVFDTALATIVSPQTGSAESNPANPVTTATHVPATAREALAQLQPTDGIRRQHSDTAGREVKLQHQRKPPRKRAVPREFLMARQPQFGWFGSNSWWR